MTRDGLSFPCYEYVTMRKKIETNTDNEWMNSALLRVTPKSGKLMIKSRKAKEVLLLPNPFLINLTLLYLDYRPGARPNPCRGDSARVCFHNSIPQVHGA